MDWTSGWAAYRWGIMTLTMILSEDMLNAVSSTPHRGPDLFSPVCNSTPLYPYLAPPSTHRRWLSSSEWHDLRDLDNSLIIFTTLLSHTLLQMSSLNFTQKTFSLLAPLPPSTRLHVPSMCSLLLPGVRTGYRQIHITDRLGYEHNDNDSSCKSAG